MKGLRLGVGGLDGCILDLFILQEFRREVA